MATNPHFLLQFEALLASYYKPRLPTRDAATQTEAEDVVASTPVEDAGQIVTATAAPDEGENAEAASVESSVLPENAVEPNAVEPNPVEPNAVVPNPVRPSIKNSVDWVPPIFKAFSDARTGVISFYQMNIGEAQFYLEPELVSPRSPFGTAEPLAEEITLYAKGCRDCLKPGCRRGHTGCPANLPYPVCFGCSRVGYAKTTCPSSPCQRNERGGRRD